MDEKDIKLSNIDLFNERQIQLTYLHKKTHHIKVNVYFDEETNVLVQTNNMAYNIKIINNLVDDAINILKKLGYKL